jgi:hypothetical protein
MGFDVGVLPRCDLFPRVGKMRQDTYWRDEPSKVLLIWNANSIQTAGAILRSSV